MQSDGHSVFTRSRRNRNVTFGPVTLSRILRARMAVRSVLAGFRRAGSLRLAVALPANVINRFNAPLGSRSNFNKKRLDWDLTSEDSDPPDYFDDWASDIDESFGRVNWGNQDPIIAEDGYSHAKGICKAHFSAPIQPVSSPGKRKRSIAKVRVKAGDGDIFINGVPHVEYFHDWVLKRICTVSNPFLSNLWSRGESRARCAPDIPPP
eukprot:1325918-Amorphochlora_amoeboformis.AAC.1